MPKQLWYVHLQGETIGPLPTDAVSAMLKQNRLQFVDFVWAKHLTKWQRIGDLDEFAALMPAYPKAPIPSRTSEAEDTNEDAPKVESKPVRKPEVKAKPEKAPPPPPPEKKTWPKSRRFVRVPVDASKAALEGHGGFDVLNVSEGGIFLKASEPLPIGTEVKFQLELKSIQKTLDMTGVVIRHGLGEGHKGFAVQFIRLNPAYKRILHEYVSNHDSEG